jgi:hypothetical protein
MKAKAAIVGITAVVALAAIGGALGSGDGTGGSTAVPTSLAQAPDASPTPTPTREPATEATPTLEPTPELEPTAEPTPEGPTQFKPGDTITVTQNDEPWAEIVVAGVDVVRKYEGGYFDDTPEIKGNRFIQAKITYKALQDGVDYNPFDWQVFANGEAVDNWSLVTNGPEPQLNSGTLPEGRKASGWVVYEVPAKGKILLSYSGNMFLDEAPIFEVVLRQK